jgi:hypothetical protein
MAIMLPLFSRTKTQGASCRQNTGTRDLTRRHEGFPPSQLSPYIDSVQHTVLSVLSLKGTMSEAELHIIRARLDGGIRNKAARGQLRRSLPVGFVWG